LSIDPTRYAPGASSGPPPAPQPISAPRLGQPPYAVVIEVVGDPIGREIARVLKRDLVLSNVFIPMPNMSGARDLRLPGQSASAAPSTTTRLTIRAAVSAASTAVEATVYFAVRGFSDPAGTIRLSGRDPRDAAHRLGNELYRIHTDTPGPFLSQIAFVAPRAGDPASRHIFVVDFAGSSPVRISTEGRHNILPDWSPRGDLAFTSFARGNPDLYLVRAGSRRMRPISARPGLNTGAAFSPNGRTIALTLTEQGNQDIYLIGTDGRLVRRLTYHPKIDVSPTWSPDARSVAFVSQRGGIPQIYLVGLSGGSPRRLTRGGSDNQEPDWCARAGSAEIAYTSRRNGTYQIFVVDVRSGQSRQLTTEPGDKQSPSWSPDCRLLAYAAGRRGLWTITRDGRQKRQLYRGSAKTPAWSH
jgi:TolB protein